MANREKIKKLKRYKNIIQFDLFLGKTIIGKNPRRKTDKDTGKESAIGTSSAPIRRAKDLETINRLFIEKVQKAGGYQ